MATKRTRKTGSAARRAPSGGRAAASKGRSRKARASAKPASSKRKTAKEPAPKRKAAKQAPASKRSASKASSSGASASKKAPASKGAGAPGTKGGRPQRGPTVRTPVGADELKERLGRLATTRGRIRTLKRTLSRSFHDIGTLLAEIEDERLHEVKGYGSFEAFLEREVDLGVQLGMRLLRIARAFRREAALAAGLDRATQALDVLEGQETAGAAGSAGGGGPTFGGPALPPHKR